MPAEFYTTEELRGKIFDGVRIIDVKKIDGEPPEFYKLSDGKTETDSPLYIEDDKPSTQESDE